MPASLQFLTFDQTVLEQALRAVADMRLRGLVGAVKQTDPVIGAALVKASGLPGQLQL
jgi:hypothetical protein